MQRPFWPYPRILAHRGGGLLAPENTLAGIRLARNLGFVGVEFDVKQGPKGLQAENVRKAEQQAS